MEVVVYLKDESELVLLESLLQRLKLRFEKRKEQINAPNTGNDYEKNLLKLSQLSAQITESSFGDPIKWQKTTREDRLLPFRDTEQ